MILDINSAILDKLTIDGRLTFKNDARKDITLNAKLIYVFSGELYIGDDNVPYKGIATIKLHGKPNDKALQFSDYAEAGNKVMTIVGQAKIIGKKRDRMSRLRETVFLGDSSAKVEKGLDWLPGDRLALLPTAMQNHHTDYVTIDRYDASSGRVDFKE